MSPRRRASLLPFDGNWALGPIIAVIHPKLLKSLQQNILNPPRDSHRLTVQAMKEKAADRPPLSPLLLHIPQQVSCTSFSTIEVAASPSATIFFPSGGYMATATLTRGGYSIRG